MPGGAFARKTGAPFDALHFQFSWLCLLMQIATVVLRDDRCFAFGQLSDVLARTGNKLCTSTRCSARGRSDFVCIAFSPCSVTFACLTPARAVGLWPRLSDCRLGHLYAGWELYAFADNSLRHARYIRFCMHCVFPCSRHVRVPHCCSCRRAGASPLWWMARASACATGAPRSGR